MSSSAIGSVHAAPPLRVDGLVKRYGQVTAVDGIMLELRPGECLGLLGPNGAGKSTLIRSIVGRVIPDAGVISIFGARADSSAARNALGWIPQELALYPRLTCQENLQSFGRYHGLSGSALEQAVTRCLAWATLTDRAGELVKNLSGGMKRRLNMAAGLIHHPKLVLMDEPTVGVDPQSRNHIFEMIQKLHAEGMSLIYTTHYMEEAERLCDRIAIIDHGKIIALGTNAELVHAAFGSRSQVLARLIRPQRVSGPRAPECRRARRDSHTIFGASGVFPAPRHSAGDREQDNSDRYENQDLWPEMGDRLVAPEHFRESVDGPRVDRQQTGLLHGFRH